MSHPLKLPSIDSVNLNGKRVLVRVDFNCPVDKQGRLMEDFKVKAHCETIQRLLEAGAAVVAITHQGRPGDDDFITLEQHAKRLSELLGRPVMFVGDVIGPTALQAIRGLGHGEVMLLDNVRLVSEELLEGEPERLAKTILVRRLAPLFDYFVFDAFATAHRSQPSVVGFPVVLPSLVGYVMRRELEALEILRSIRESPKVFVIGGAKVDDALKIAELLHRRRIADKILVAGLVGLVFRAARGAVSDEVMKVIRSKKLEKGVALAKQILEGGAPIEMPQDVRTLKNGDIAEEPIEEAKGVPLDIGPQTVSAYSDVIKRASMIVMKGPAGYIEDARFRWGTLRLLEVALQSRGYLAVGGGHLVSMLNELGIRREGGLHVSTGGGALFTALAEERLPAVAALELSYKKFFAGGPH